MPEAAERMGVEMYLGIQDYLKNAAIYTRTTLGLAKKTDAYGKSVEKSTKGADQSWTNYTDNLIKSLDEQERQVEEVKKSNDEFANNTKRNTEQAGNSWKQFSQSMIGQVANVKAIIDGARFALTAFIGPFKQFMALGKEAVGLQLTQKRFRDLVGGVEEYEEALVDMREATQGTIRDTQLIDSSFNILRRGYANTAASAATLARNIQLTSQMAGQVPTMESAMQVFSLMMSNQSKMRVDAFGLTIEQVDNRIAHLKDTLGKTEEEAFSLAILQLLDEQVGDLGLTAETAITKLNRMETQFGNLGDNLKSLVVPLFEDFVDVVTGGAEKININIDTIKERFALFVGTMRGHVAQLGESLQVLVFGFLSMTEAIKGNADEAVRFFELAQDSFQRVVDMKPMEEALEQAATMYESVSDAAVSSADAQVDALGQVEAAWDALAAATAAYEEEVAGVTAELEAKAAQDTIQEFRKVQDAAIAAARQREETARQTAAKIVAIEQQLAGSIAKAHSTYQASLQRIDKQGADQRLKIEEDFQKRRRDILRRFEMSETQAIRARDAGALSDARAQRDEELAQAEEQRNEQLENARRSQEAQTQAAQEALNQQLAAAKQAYNDQLAALQASLLEQEEARKRKQKQDEEDAQRAREREQGDRLQAAGDKIAGIYLANQEELVAMRQHYNTLTIELQNYYNNVVQYYAAIAQITGSSQGVRPGGVGPVQGSRQGGGYMSTPGLYRGGETGTEFAMDATTTRAMGGALGGLTQTSLRQLASAISSPGTVNHSVSGDISGNIDVVLRQGIAGMEGRLMAAMNRQMREIFKVR